MIKKSSSDRIMKKLAQFVTEIVRRMFGASAKSAGETCMDLAMLPGSVQACSTSLTDEVIRLMAEEKVYKCPHLDLKSLSERLQTPSYLVTKALNEGLGLSFYELINRYRVEEAKSLLIHHDYKRFTVMSVAFDAGFNSKTTFNTVFKKMTGVTPTHYRSRNCLVRCD
jgi:AraC-like DNA-binding protein